MASSNFQIVFVETDQVEIYTRVDGVLRMTEVDFRGAPCSLLVMGEPEVKEPLKAWMLATGAPNRIGWPDIEAALTSGGVDVASLLARRPQ